MKARVAIVSLVGVLAGCSSSSEEEFFIRPYLQNPIPGGITVLWWTHASAPDSHVMFGRGELDGKAPATNVYVPAMRKWLHEAAITGLEAETEYRYRAVSGPIASRRRSFRTGRRRYSDLRISFLGDGRTDFGAVVARHRKVLKMAAAQADLVFEIGDMVYRGSAKHWERLFREVVPAAGDVPYLMAVGNHEIFLRRREEHAPGKFEGAGYAGGNLHTAMARFKAFAANPPNGSANPHWEERYYAVRCGCVTVIVLDANNTSDDALDNHDRLEDGDTPDWEPGSEQYKWMVAQLARAQADSAFTFVCFHPSPYCRGVHGTDDPKVDEQRGHELRALDPVLRRHGVDAVITSHDHLVEHCLTGPEGFEKKMDVNDPANLNYLVMGNSGHTSRLAEPGWEKWMSVRGDGREPFHTKWFYTWDGWHHLASFFDVRIVHNGDGTWTASFRTVRSDGKVFNEFSIRRTDPRPPPGAAQAAN